MAKIATHADIVNSGGSTSSSYDSKRCATKSAAASYSNVTVLASSKTDKQLIDISEYNVSTGGGYTYDYYITIDSSTVAVGSTVECYAYFDTYYNGVLQSSESVYGTTDWTSDNSSIATVSGIGTVTGVSAGSTYINGEYYYDGEWYYDYVRVTVTGSGSGGGSAEDYINISPTWNRFDPAGSTCTVSVDASRTDWYFVEGSDWLSGSKTSNTSGRITGSANTSGASRGGFIALKSGSATAIFNADQDLYDGSNQISVSPETLYFSNAYGSKTVTVNGSSSYSVTDAAGWITTSKSGQTVTITCNKNASGAQREDVVRIYNNSMSVYVNVIQYA